MDAPPPFSDRELAFIEALVDGNVRFITDLSILPALEGAVRAQAEHDRG